MRRGEATVGSDGPIVHQMKKDKVGSYVHFVRLSNGLHESRKTYLQGERQQEMES
jgi:hypothetical protein